MTENSKKSVLVRVVGFAGKKTLIAESEFYKKHALYGKYMKRSKRYLVHDFGAVAALDDQIEIVESRPISKSKNWVLSRVVNS